MPAPTIRSCLLCLNLRGNSGKEGQHEVRNEVSALRTLGLGSCLGPRHQPWLVERVERSHVLYAVFLRPAVLRELWVRIRPRRVRHLLVRRRRNLVLL